MSWFAAYLVQASAGAMAGAWNIHISPQLAKTLTGWGPQLKQKARNALQCWRDRNPGQVLDSESTSFQWDLGTDFSGIEAPVFALQELGYFFKHRFSCEFKKEPQQIASLCIGDAEKQFFNIFDRHMSELPGVSLYCSGFPCTPFSMLHHRTKLLRDSNARQFFASTRTLHHCRPAVAIFENVLGAKRVLPRLQRCLGQGGLYHVIVLEMNPRDLGQPQNRPRLYFLVLRRDVAIGNKEQLEELASLMWTAMHEADTMPCDALLLPDDHPHIQASKQQGQKRQQAHSDTTGAKWRKQHSQFCVADLAKRSSAAARHPAIFPTPQEMGLVAPREIDVWQRLRSLGVPLAVDLSQSLGRACRTDACVPTVTPAGKIAVVCNKVRRLVTPEEKLLLQGFPLHRMRFPEGLSSAAIGRCAGNAMHVRCIAAAIVIATALVSNGRPWHDHVLGNVARHRQSKKQPEPAPVKKTKKKSVSARRLLPANPARIGGVPPCATGGVTPCASAKRSLEGLFRN